MKKTLLIATLILALAGIATAQDVYSGGARWYDAGSAWIPCVYKNGTMLYHDGEPGDGYHYDSYSLMTVETVDGTIGVSELPSGLYLIRCGETTLRFTKN